MRRRLLAALGLIGLAGVLALLGLLRPWATYNPIKLNTMFAEDQRVAHFRAMEGLMPYRVVDAADRPFQFDAAPAAIVDQYSYAGETRRLDDFLTRVDATGLLVIQDDRIVHEQYRLGASETTRHTSWSVAKSFVATLVGVALREGRIASLDDPMDRYAPSLTGSVYEGVPIRHVLEMSSGIDFDETYNSRRSDIQMLFVKLFAFRQRLPEVLHDYDRARPSGSHFHYASIETQALGQLLSELYDQPLSKLLEDKLWQPLGMAGQAYWNTDRMGEQGMELAFCCLNAQLRDYAKLGRLYLQQGQWQGRALLPDGWVPMATTPPRQDMQPGQSDYAYGPRGYGLHWWIPADAQREYFAAGVWGQYIYVSEPDRLIIVRSSVDPAYRANMDESIGVFRAIRDGLRAAATAD